MRIFVTIAMTLLVLIGAAGTNTTAQQSSLRDLLPNADAIGADFTVSDDRARSLAEQAAAFANPDDAARRSDPVCELNNGLTSATADIENGLSGLRRQRIYRRQPKRRQLQVQEIGNIGSGLIRQVINRCPCCHDD